MAQWPVRGRLEGTVRRRIAMLLPVLAALAATPARADQIAGATYDGTAASGGTVSFDVSADGNAITRFAVTDVPTTCGTITATTTGTVPIVDHAFSYTPAMNLRFSGSFPGAQQAQGTLSLKSVYPSCTSADVAWTATTTAQPPPPPDTTAPAVALAGATSQRLTAAGVQVKVGCPAERCTAVATGAVKVKGGKSYRLRGASAPVAQGGTTSLRLKLSATALRAVRKALAKKRRVTASITVTATDAAGNATVRRRTVTLRR